VKNIDRILAGIIAIGSMASLGCREDVQSPTDPESAAVAPSLATASTPLSFRMLSAGNFRSCGVTTDNRAYCWGQNGGQLGDGTMINRTMPVMVAGGLLFRQVSAGGNHVCGVTTDDRAYCWGENYSGQLGDGTTTTRTTPVAVVGGHLFRSVRAGGNHTCGVTFSNKAYCWGSNTVGQVGDSSDINRRQRPVRVAGGLSFRQVISGGSHTCGVTTSDKAYCWGWGEHGQIGDGKTVERHWPRAVAGGLSFRQISAGGFHSCGLTLSDRAYCWGDNFDGRIGDGTTGTNRLKPVAVVGGLRFSGISPGSVHTCAVTPADRAYCWGNNTVGELGDGSTTRSSVPVAVAGGLQIDLVSAGGAGENSSHTCGLTTGNKAYCWGSNFVGQLGDGTTTDRHEPVAVIGP
jgi:alpha-tubulin suppressor-like RCC1 family protein